MVLYFVQEQQLEYQHMFIEDGDLCHIELEKIGLIKNLAKKTKTNT